MIKTRGLYGLLSLFFCVNQAVAAIDGSIDLPPYIDIEQSGIFSVLEPSQQTFRADSTAGYSSVVKTQLVAETSIIPMRQGLVFGFNYAVVDLRLDDEWIVVDVDIQHPQTINYLGHRSTGFTQQSTVRLSHDGRYRNGIFYVLSEEYEFVPGQWVITVRYGDTEVSQQFLLVDQENHGIDLGRRARHSPE